MIHADLVLRGGAILTAANSRPRVGALAVLRRRILAVGDDGELDDLIGPGTRVVDLEGRTAIPGMVDNHTHYIMAGLDSPVVGARANIARSSSIEALLAEVADKARTTPRGDWVITSCMYRGPLAEGRFPTRHDLDRAAPEHPVYVIQSGKNIIVNSLALSMAGIDGHTLDPVLPEGHVVKDNAGQPTGHLIAGAADMARSRWWQAMGVGPRMWDFPYYDQETLIGAIQAQGEIYLQCGIVAVRDMGVAPHELGAYQAAHDTNRLPVRVDAVLGLPFRFMSTEEGERRIAEYFGPGTGFGDDWLRIGGLKLVVQNDGWWAYSPDMLRRLVLAANDRGWTLAFHVSSGHSPDAWDTVLSVLEEADARHSILGRRFSVEHGLGLTAEFTARVAALDLVVAANPLLCNFGAGRTLRMNSAIGSTRITKTTAGDAATAAAADWGLHLRDWHDAGLLVTGGTDNPAVVYDPEHPLAGIYCAVTGQTLAGVLLPGQQITRDEALRMWTINNATAVNQSHSRGSLEPGKLADITVLSDDFEQCTDDDLYDLRVDMTLVDGRVAYER